MTAHRENVSKLAELIHSMGSKPSLDREIECYSCGDWSRMNVITNYREWVDQGRVQNGFFCDDCRIKGRDKLL